MCYTLRKVWFIFLGRGKSSFNCSCVKLQTAMCSIQHFMWQSNTKIKTKTLSSVWVNTFRTTSCCFFICKYFLVCLPTYKCRFYANSSSSDEKYEKCPTANFTKKSCVRFSVELNTLIHRCAFFCHCGVGVFRKTCSFSSARLFTYSSRYVVNTAKSSLIWDAQFHLQLCSMRRI